MGNLYVSLKLLRRYSSILNRRKGGCAVFYRFEDFGKDFLVSGNAFFDDRKEAHVCALVRFIADNLDGKKRNVVSLASNCDACKFHLANIRAELFCKAVFVVVFL